MTCISQWVMFINTKILGIEGGLQEFNRRHRNKIYLNWSTKTLPPKNHFGYSRAYQVFCFCGLVIVGLLSCFWNSLSIKNPFLQLKISVETIVNKVSMWEIEFKIYSQGLSFVYCSTGAILKFFIIFCKRDQAFSFSIGYHKLHRWFYITIILARFYENPG